MALTTLELMDVTRWQIRHCGERLSEIDVVRQSVPPNSERERSLDREKAELKATRRVLEAKLRALETPPEPDPTRKAKIDAWLNSRREDILKGVSRREREGDYRDALIWRNEILRLADQLVNELGL